MTQKLQKYVSKTRFDSKLAQANVVTKRNCDAKILEIEINLKISQTFDLSYIRGKNYYEEDGKQNYLVFQPMIRYFKIISNTKYILSSKSKGLSDETITPYATSDNSLTPFIDHYGSKIRLKFSKSCLKQDKITYTHRKIVNIYIVYEIISYATGHNYPTLENCLFSAVT